MDPVSPKSNLLRNVLVRCFSFAVIILAVRFTCLVALKGGSCSSGDFCFTRVPTRASRSVTVTVTPPRLLHFYSAVFQDLIAHGYLAPASTSLCIASPNAVAALREIGVSDSIGISKKASPSLIVSGEAHLQPFDDNTFDFEFCGEGGLERSAKAAESSAEICRTMKPSGFLVVHTISKDSYSLHSLLDLFNCCKLIETRNISGPDSATIREIVMKKESQLPGYTQTSTKSASGGKCSVPGFKREILRKAEHLIEEEPTKPWITLRRNKKNIKYLTSMVDISFKRKYIYVDAGGRNYGSSMGRWFKKQYPKQNKSFEIYAMEGGKGFHGEYARKKGVTVLPYAAWTRNETLFFEIRREEKGRLEEKVKPSTGLISDVIQGIDFAGWLKSVASEKDLVVMKMDVEGAEFEVVERMMETGAVCLVDEMFLKCHYKRCCSGGRSPKAKYLKTYSQCLKLLRSLRESGVLVHQWS